MLPGVPGVLRGFDFLCCGGVGEGGEGGAAGGGWGGHGWGRVVEMEMGVLSLLARLLACFWLRCGR